MPKQTKRKKVKKIKLTKKQAKKLNEEISKVEFEYPKPDRLTWEEMNTPFNI